MQGRADEMELAPGCPVEVRTRFDGRWVGGFRLVACEAAGLVVARSRDGSTLPELFTSTEVRPLVAATPASWPASA